MVCKEWVGARKRERDENFGETRKKRNNSQSDLLESSALVKLLPLLVAYLTMHEHGLHLPCLLHSSIHLDLRLRVLLRVLFGGSSGRRRRRRELRGLLYDVGEEVRSETLGAVGWEDVEGQDVEFERS